MKELEKLLSIICNSKILPPEKKKDIKPTKQKEENPIEEFLRGHRKK